MTRGVCKARKEIKQEACETFREQYLQEANQTETWDRLIVPAEFSAENVPRSTLLRSNWNRPEQKHY